MAVVAGQTDRSPTVRLRWLRFNAHHLSFACIVALVVGVAAYGWPIWTLLIFAPLLALVVTDAIARPQSPVFYPTVTRGSRIGNKVALTFDDGPDPDNTLRVLDALAEHGTRATFFVIGRSFAAHPEIAARMVAEGHAIGNHSWQHSRMQNFRSARWHQAEIDRCERLLDAVARTDRPGLYRPPVGLKSGELVKAIWSRRLTVIAWSLHSRDTRLASAEAVANRVLGRIRPGDIVLLHDGHDRPGDRRPLCADAVRLILAGLGQKGLECVTIPELLSADAAGPREK